ncbi:hypothetical protein SAMN04489760_102175 [Syntrophus gentianae]|uniref:VPLPA-CTERM protein sorting domain-containing protein n=1 Tax=Syntrophus gentianae TaxID=43775 RepID=A0A1H7UYF7_9BACT|nr:hypothetical protein SAMN04489760_102175 [Syntrophus gentianae]
MKSAKLFLIGLVVLLFASSGHAMIWNWSFSTEAGTFTTDGTGTPGWYNVSDFSVTSTGMGATIGSWSGSQYAASGYSTETPYKFQWDGSAVVKWDSAGSNSFDWLVFKDLAQPYYYFFGWETGNFNTVDQAAYYYEYGSVSQPSYHVDVDQGGVVPIPGAILLFAPGLAGLIAVRRRLKV